MDVWGRHVLVLERFDRVGGERVGYIIALSLVINNVDDHLRNHGLLREASGWRLSPALDINPHPDVGVCRATTIGFVDETKDGQSALLASAQDFGLDPKGATAIWSRSAPVMDRFRE